MWCKLCRQDVPAFAAPGNCQLSCPRCGGGISADPAGQQVASEVGSDPTPAPSQPQPDQNFDDSPSYDSWEMDQRLRHIERVLDAGDGEGRRKHVSRPQATRLDTAHAHIPAWHLGTPAQPLPLEPPLRAGSTSILAAFGWGALSLGTMALCCGGILVGWSALTGRQELWNVGTPVAICGQIALVIGLVLQLDRLWHDGRYAAAKLDRVGRQLHELKTATAMLGTSHASPGAAFYSHMVEGANPQILLSDLKGQLDLLAVKLSKNEEL